MAIGATRAQVVGAFVDEGLRLVLIGGTIGCAAAASRVPASILFGVTPLDPVTFVAAAAMLVAVTGMAADSQSPRCAHRSGGSHPIELSRTPAALVHVL